MNLYEVIFHWAEGRNDDADTIYLVRASDFRSAIEIACRSLSTQHHATQARPIMPDVVYEIGKDSSIYPQPEALWLRGPYVQCAYNYGWKKWQRKIDRKTGVHTNEWEEIPSEVGPI